MWTAYQFSHGLAEQLRGNETTCKEPLVKTHHEGVIQGLLFRLNEANIKSDYSFDLGGIQCAVHEANALQ